jgi:phospholipid/cholesterol/gamma-HCH transport system substrate-binding protein
METSARYIFVGLFALVAIMAGFAFVYWLNNTGGLGKRDAYQIRFQGAVSGLQTGAAVQFNGIRVGEVTGLGLDRDNPGEVVAQIAVEKGTPLRADTKVTVDFQGLMGTPLISLKGGTLTSPALSSSPGGPTLVADAAAGEDLTQTARGTLQQVDKVLEENRESLKDTIDNLKTFSGALARNSNHIDGIMAGLEHLAGGGPTEKPKPVYDLTVSVPSSTSLHGQLAVAEPTAVVALDTQRILSRSSEGQISLVGDAQWSDALPKLIQSKIVESLQNAGMQTVMSEPMAGVSTGNQLLLDLRDFSIAAGAEPTANVAFAAKIVAADGHVIAMHVFHAAVPTKGDDTPTIVAAFDQAFSQTVAGLITWMAAAAI